MDQAFLPCHYEAAPRQMFFHSLMALSPIRTGLAPFFAATNSFRRARAATKSMSLEKQAEIVPGADETRTKLPGYLRPYVAKWQRYEFNGGQQQLSDLPAQDRQVYEVPAQYEEVTLDPGDLLILDPMLMHSASANAGELLPFRCVCRLLSYCYSLHACEHCIANSCIYTVWSYGLKSLKKLSQCCML